MPWRWILALVWLVAWCLAARGFWGASEEQSAEAARLALPLSGVAPGEVRVMARAGTASRVQGPLSRREGVAVLLQVDYGTTYLDSQDKTQHESQVIATRRLGATEITLEVGPDRIVLPAERFEPDPQLWAPEWRDFERLPEDFGISRSEIEQAKSRARGDFHHYGVREWVVQEGASFFVAGKLGERDAKTGSFRIEADPVLKRVVLFPGTQAEIVAKRGSSANGLRIAGWIVLGVGFLPAAIFGILALRKRSMRGRDVSG